jgi:hypothetical protein
LERLRHLALVEYSSFTTLDVYTTVVDLFESTIV